MTTHILDNMIAFTMKLIFFKEVTFLKEKGRDESKPFFFFTLYLHSVRIQKASRPDCLVLDDIWRFFKSHII